MCVYTYMPMGVYQYNLQYAIVYKLLKSIYIWCHEYIYVVYI